MCSECGCYPCHPSCPNAVPEKSVATCPYCDEPIYAGEDVFELNGELYHEDCVSDMPVSQLLAMFGVEREVA